MISIMMYFFFVNNYVEEEWSVEYSIEDGYCMEENIFWDDSDYLYCVGEGKENGEYIWFVLKYNNKGEKVDEIKKYSNEEISFAITMNGSYKDNNDFYLVGYTYKEETKYDCVLLKINFSGEEWHRIYGDSSSDVPWAVSLDRAGNIYVCGYSKQVHENGLNTDGLILKYNKAGDLEWVNFYNSSYSMDDYYTDLIIKEDDGIYTIGYAIDEYYQALCLIGKYSFNGEERWSDVGVVSGRGRDIMVGRYGSIYVAGYGGLIRYEEDGERTWVVGEIDERYRSLDIDQDGNIYVTGDKGRDLVVVKYDRDGNVLWRRIYDGGEKMRDSGQKIKIKNRGVYVLGHANINDTSGGTWTWSTVLIKYDLAGNKMWEIRRSSDINDFVISDNGDIYMAGTKVDSTTKKEKILLIKYKEYSGIEERRREPDLKIMVEESVVKIRAGAGYRMAKFRILDMNGRVIKKGTIKEEITEINGLKTGIYFVKITSRGIDIVRKFIIMR